MIGIVEKIVWGLSVLAILACGAVWLIGGPPGTTPIIAGRSQTTTEKEFIDKLPPEQQTQLKERLKRSEELKLSSGGSHAKAAKPKQEYLKVNRAVYDRVSNINRARHELDKAKSEFVRDKEGKIVGLKIFDFNPSSALRKLGLEENDVIQAVDGEVINFESTADCYEAYNRKRPQLESGMPLIITVERNGTPMQIVFSIGE